MMPAETAVPRGYLWSRERLSELCLQQLRLFSLLRLIPPTFTPLVRSRANAGRIRMAHPAGPSHLRIPVRRTRCP